MDPAPVVEQPTATAAGVEARAWFAAIVGTVSVAFPAFLTGAITVQLKDDLRLSATEIGVAIAASFAAAAAASYRLGRIAERMGPQAALRLALATSAATMFAIAAFVEQAWSLTGLLALAGVANGLAQPAANLLLATAVPARRLGLAMAAKQSGVPGGALLGGVAVPALALTVGWRWAFVGGAVLALAVIAVPPRVGTVHTSRQEPAKPDLSTRLLMMYSLVGLLGAAAAGSLVAFLTAGAERSGIDAGSAGLLLSSGALVGISVRLVQGWEVDRRQFRPIMRVVALMAVGAACCAALAVDRPGFYLAFTLPTFAFGWSWPGLLNLSVIRNNPSAPAAATGTTQTGVYIGAAAGPAIAGLTVDAVGYGALWFGCALALAASAVVARVLAGQMARRRGTV
ncbi:MAG: MFS transporter [Pseudomonadota bacterium]